MLIDIPAVLCKLKFYECAAEKCDSRISISVQWFGTVESHKITKTGETIKIALPDTTLALFLNFLWSLSISTYPISLLWKDEKTHMSYVFKNWSTSTPADQNILNWTENVLLESHFFPKKELIAWVRAMGLAGDLQFLSSSGSYWL